MATISTHKCSNQELWKIITGHSSLRRAGEVEKELCSKENIAKFKLCLNYYKPQSPTAEKSFKDIIKAKIKADSSDRPLTNDDISKSNYYKFLSELSAHLALDQLQTYELFLLYLVMCYKGIAEDPQTILSEKREWNGLMADLRKFYFSERLRLLQCVRHLYGYWQDHSHPYQKAYCECLEKVDLSGEVGMAEMVWTQYESSVKQPPLINAAGQREVWAEQSFKEQCSLLEIVLLYYKDFNNNPKFLLRMIKFMSGTGYGSQQPIRLGPGAQKYIQYINFLYSLILVECVNLDHVVYHRNNQSALDKHPFLTHGDPSSVHQEIEELEKLMFDNQWNSVECHAPFLLAWMLLRYCTCSDPEDFQQYQPLGEAALQCGVFDYLQAVVGNTHFTSSTPLSSLGKALVHTLLSLTIACFSVSSLGDLGTLVAIATRTLTNPRLKLELWEKHADSQDTGVGVLLSEAMTTFPQDTPYSLLCTLSDHPNTAGSVTKFLLSHKILAVELTSDWCVVVNEDQVTLTQSTQLFVQESAVLGNSPLTLPAGSEGQLLPGDLVGWESPLSALDILTLITVSLLHEPGVGVDLEPHPLVDTVTEIIGLVRIILKNDCSLYKYFKSIIAQCYRIIQRYSPLPQPPTKLIAACVQCLAVLASNDHAQVWEELGRTGFLPYVSGPASNKRVPVSPGHFGSILNSWERNRGVYDVTMAALELLLGGVASTDLLGPVVWVCEEIMASSSQWRYITRSSRDELAHKLLVLAHTTLEVCKSTHVRDYLVNFLTHSHGHRQLVVALSLGVDEVDKLLTNQKTVQISSLKLAFSIIDKLLASKSAGEDCSLLEHTLATQPVSTESGSAHLISVIASYIHHHGNPHVPLGATKLLTRLSLVSPMSVFACLGQMATPIRDAFVRRLGAIFEEVELKGCILELISASVQCQPGMAELFLSVTNNNSKYSLGKNSCLDPVLGMLSVSPRSPVLLAGAVNLLACLWEGRHDAALIALRGTPDFWKNLTSPLREQGCQPCVVAKVMDIVAMETHYTVRGLMDEKVKDVVGKIAKSEVGIWLEVPPTGIELVKSVSSLLLVLTTAPDTKDFFKSPDLHLKVLKSILSALETQMVDPEPDVAMVTELSTLYTVLLRKWSNQSLGFLGNQLLALMTGVQLNSPIELTRPLYSTILLALQTSKRFNESLEPRLCVGLIPHIAVSLQAIHAHQERKSDVVCVYVLNEIVRSQSPDLWLPPLQQAVLGQILVRRLDNLLTQLSDHEVVEAIIVLFLGMSGSKSGAESLLMNGIAHTLCISLTGLVSLPNSQSEWREVWLLALKLNTAMLHSIGHQFVSHTLDFVFVHWDKLSTSLDIGHVVKELPLLRESQATCRLLLGLSLFQSHWKYSQPTVVHGLLQYLVTMVTSTAAVLSKRTVLKHIVRAMYSGGHLSPSLGPVAPPTKSRSVGRSVSVDQAQLDDSLVTSCPAFSLLQQGLLSILSSCLSALRQFSPPLDAMIVDGVLDLAEYPPLFAPSLTPPTLDNTTPPSLGSLTTSLTALLSLLNKTDPGSPVRSSERSPVKRAELVSTIEQGLFLLLSQATRYLVDPQTPDTDKQLLKKEISSELNSFLQSLQLTLSRTSGASPGRTPSRSRTSDPISRQNSLAFSSDHPLLNFAETFNRHFLS